MFLDAKLPTKESKAAAGFHLYTTQSKTVPAHGQVIIPIDLAIQLPFGTYRRVAPWGGLVAKNSIDILAGVIYADYWGTIGVILFNHSSFYFNITKHDRIAQLIIKKIANPQLHQIKTLPKTTQQDEGFGSIGIQNISTSLPSPFHTKLQQESSMLGIDTIDVYKYYTLEKIYKNKRNLIYVPSSLYTELITLFYDSP